MKTEGWGRRNLGYWAGAGILLAAFALRVFRLGDANVWWDEGLAMWAVRKSFWETTRWTACDVHPPLYFWTLWPWTRLVGYGEFGARFITVMVGLLTVALLVPLGKRLGGWQLGLLAAGLLAVARFHVWWSQEMRMYALAALLHVAALLALTRWWETRSRRAWLAYVLATTGGLYTIYLSAVILVVCNLWVGGQWVVGWWRNRQSSTVNRQLSIFSPLFPWILAQLVILALFIPWFGFAAGCMSSWSVAEPVNYSFVLQLQATLLTLGISTNLDTVLPLVVGLTLLLGAGGVVLTRQRAARPYVALLLLVLALPSLVIFALALPRGLFYNPRVEARYFLPFAPPVYLLFAWGLLALARWRRLVGVAALGCVLAAFAWSLPQQYADRTLHDDLQGMVQALRAYARPTDRVILVSGDRYPIFLYYYDRLMPNDRPAVEQVPHSAAKLAPDNVDRELRRVTRDQDRVWLAWVNGPLQDPQELAPDWLKQHYKTSLSYGFAHNSLTLFTPDGAPPVLTQGPTARDIHASVSGQTFIQGYDLPTHEYSPGDTLRLGLYWNGPAAQGVVRLAPLGNGPDNRLTRVSRPAALPAGPSRAQVELPIVPFMAAGDYRFELVTGEGGTTFGRFTVRGTPASGPSTPATPLEARLGEGVRLLGLSLLDERGQIVQQLRPETTVYADLFWQADAALPADYTVFVHLLGNQFNSASGGPVWAGHDSPPANGLYPTSWWTSGVGLRDRHPLELPADLPPGDYQLEIGMYDVRGERLPTAGAQADPAQRRILGPTLRVSP
ncbi:MAG: glycosyltransferase family 39 protein [Anaerolineae bacterium]|nr:glycosyltransferase family 39 protein [Anaerolineae bacterium]